MSNLYRKKSVVIEAIRYTRNDDEIKSFLGNACMGIFTQKSPNGESFVKIKTIDGIAMAFDGDYIVIGANGGFYPCKPDIFEKTYEKVEEE